LERGLSICRPGRQLPRDSPDEWKAPDRPPAFGVGDSRAKAGS
jgi:hypothetical protein